MEFVDRRKLFAPDEPEVPAAVDVVKDRMDRATTALLNGDMAGVAAVEAECQNPPTTYGDVVEFKSTKGLLWKSVGYVLAMLPIGQAQPLLMLRAVGMRTDEKVFSADYALPPVWEEGWDYTKEARQRLNTFMKCGCDSFKPCEFHQQHCPGPLGPGQWLEWDLQRLQKVQSAPLPEAVEVLMKAEAARSQNRIVVPGRG